MAIDISQLSDEELNTLITQKSPAATGVTKHGVQNLTDEQLDALIRSKQQMVMPQAQPPETNMLGVAGAGIAGAARGATVGLSDPVIAGVYAGVEAVKEKAVGDQRPITEIAKDKYQEGVQAIDTLKQKYPEVSTATEIAGAFAPSPVNVGTKVIRAGEAVGKVAAEKLAPGLIKTGLERAIGGAAGGLGLGSVQGGGAIAQGKEAPDLATSAAIGAGLQVGLPVAGKALGAAGAGVKAAASGVGSFVSENILRVNPELAKQFIKRSKEILNAPTVDQFTTKVKKIMSDAGSDYVLIKDEISELIKKTIDNQNNKVSNLSSKAFDVLDTALNAKKKPVVIDTRSASLGVNKLKATMMPYLERTQVGGVTIDPQSAKKIQTMFDTIDQMDRYIPASDVKKWIQYIDNESSNLFATDPALKGSQYERGLIRFREELNNRLGNAVPEYRKFMKSIVAPATRLKNQLDERFGTDGKINQAISKWENEIVKLKPGLKGKAGKAIEETIVPTKPFAAGPQMSEPEIVLDKLNVMEDLVRGIKKSGQFDSTLNSFFKQNALLKNDPTAARTLEYVNLLTNDDLQRVANDVQLRKMYDNIVPKNWIDLFNPVFLGVGGVGVSYLAGLDPYTLGASIFLAGTAGPPVAKFTLNQMAAMQGIPTVQKFQSLQLPDNVKNNLISGFIQYVNSSTNRGPITIGDPNVGKEVQSFLKQIPDPILRAKNLSSLHKDKSVDPDVIKNLMLQGISSSDIGALSKYMQTKVAPSIEAAPKEGKKEASSNNTLYTFGGYEQEITNAATEAGIPVELLAALIRQESNFNPKAVSRTGAKGIGQFIKSTAESVGLKTDKDPKKDERFIPEKALPASAKLIRNLYEKYNSWPLALTAYNAGEGAVDNALKTAKGNEKKAIKLLNRQEAREYAKKVLSHYDDIMTIRGGDQDKVNQFDLNLD